MTVNEHWKCKRNSFLWFILPRRSVISIWACNLLRESWFWLTQKTCFMKHNATHQYWHQMWCVFGLTASAGCVLAWRSKSHSFNSGVWVHRTSLSQLAGDTVGLMWFIDSRWLVSVLNSCSLWHNATDRGSCFYTEHFKCVSNISNTCVFQNNMGWCLDFSLGWSGSFVYVREQQCEILTNLVTHVPQ